MKTIKRINQKLLSSIKSLKSNKYKTNKKTKYITSNKPNKSQTGGAGINGSSYAICFIWVNYNIDNTSKNFTKKTDITKRTIYKGNPIDDVKAKYDKSKDDFKNNILDKLLTWQKNHPRATIYLGYDSTTTDGYSIINTQKIIDEANATTKSKIILFDLQNVITDDFTSGLIDFIKKNNINKDIIDKTLKTYDQTIYCGIPPQHPSTKINDYLAQIDTIFLKEYIFGSHPIYGEISPLYFRIDMFRILLTLYLSKLYDYIVYSDLDVEPSQPNLNTPDTLFDEQTMIWLSSVGFVTCTKYFRYEPEKSENGSSPFKSYEYENGFHILNSNDKLVYNSLLIICIYINIIRLIAYISRYFYSSRTPSANCMKEIFTQIVYVSYKQLFVYLHYVNGTINLYAQLKSNSDDGEYIEIKEDTTLIPLLGLNCKNANSHHCPFLNYKKTQKYIDLMTKIKQYRPDVPIKLELDDEYLNEIPDNEQPTKEIEIEGSEMPYIDCKNQAVKTSE